MTSPVSAVEAIEKAMEKAMEGDMSAPLNAIDRLRMLVGGVNTHNFDMHDADWVLDAFETLLPLARQAEALQRENAELREALEPFASVASYFDHLADDGHSVMVNVRLGDLRRARALLGGSENAE